MASRQETQNKKRLMRESIINLCTNGQMQEGDLLPPVRVLARQYGLSVNLVCEVIQSLAVDRVLNTKPGTGTTVGKPHSQPSQRGTYLFLLPENNQRTSVSSTFLGTVLRGFETSVAEMGGACLTLELEKARQYAISGELQPLAGIFCISPVALNMLLSVFPEASDVSGVFFGDPKSRFSIASQIGDATCSVDSIQFDDFDGGLQATKHLLASGYDKIAFLAMHSPDSPGDYSWSAQRELGWLQAINQAAKSGENLVFHPQHTPSLEEQTRSHENHGSEQVEAAREAVKPLVAAIRKRRVNAVVAANLYCTRTLFAVLEEDDIAPRLWPAVVCFDGLTSADNHIVSALNLPWDQVGKVAAQLLWERSVGRLHGDNSARLVPMQLIPRLTCRPDWMTASVLLDPHLEILTLSEPPHGLKAPLA